MGTDPFHETIQEDLMENNSKPKGWFSRRHQTAEAHLEAQGNHISKAERQYNARADANGRASRSSEKQIDLLDARLGKGKGAARERARLGQVHVSTNASGVYIFAWPR